MQACELFDVARDRPLHAEGRGPMFSSSSFGFQPTHSGDPLCPCSGVRVLNTSKCHSQVRLIGKRSISRINANCCGSGKPTLLALNLHGGRALAFQYDPQIVRLTTRLDAPGPRSAATSGRELHAAPLPSVAIATAIPPDPCAFPVADHMYVLGVGNKQDYAHAHGWELHLSAGLIDPAVTAVSAQAHGEKICLHLMVPLWQHSHRL